MYEDSNLFSYASLRATASNILASRIKAIRQDLTNGKDHVQATDSIIVKAYAVVEQKGVISSGIFVKEKQNG